MAMASTFALVPVTMTLVSALSPACSCASRSADTRARFPFAETSLTDGTSAATQTSAAQVFNFTADIGARCSCVMAEFLADC